VFTRPTGGGFTEQAELVGTDSSGTFANTDQGSSVALSGDGNTAAVVGVQGNGAGGAAWVFTRSTDGGWTQQALLVGVGSYFFSVSLSHDGNTAIVGDTDGAVVYTRSTVGKWSQDATLPGTGSPLIAFNGLGGTGFSVSLSADGNTAMVGTSVFTRLEVGWTQQKLPAGTGAVGDAAQGASVALSGDGYTAIVGGPRDNNGAGAAWVYSEFVFPGTPGYSNCLGQRISAITSQFGGLNNARAALGFSNMSAVQDAVVSFCGG
jgi:hypothetical protein